MLHFAHSFSNSFYSPSLPFSHPLTQSVTHSLTHSVTQSLTRISLYLYTPIQVDAAARVLDPVFVGVNSRMFLAGVFLKDYKPSAW